MAKLEPCTFCGGNAELRIASEIWHIGTYKKGRCFMKFREPAQRYSVGKHGSEHIDYSGPAMICPECQGTNVREVAVEDGSRSGDYLCDDCGCEFDTWIGTELTRFGKVIEKITWVMAVIFFIAAGVCLFSGLFYLLYTDHIYGNGNVPDDLMRIGFAITIGGSILCVILSSAVYAIHERI